MRRSRGLFGVREAARKDRSRVFTALLHHLGEELLTSSFYDLKKQASAGVDGVTWQEYRQDLEERIHDLHGRIHRGASGRSHPDGHTSTRPMVESVL